MIHKLTSSKESQGAEPRQNDLFRQFRKLLVLALLPAASVVASCASTQINVEQQSCNTRSKCTLPADFPEVKMELLKFLIPAKENYADSTKMPEGLSVNQRPPLWPCDKPDNDKHTSSLAIEAVKQAKSFLEQADSRHKERLQQLTLLNKIMESIKTSMNSRGNIMRNSDKSLMRIKKIYRDNLRTTQNLAPNWDRFLGRITELQTEINQLVQFESEVGAKSGQCAKTQPEFTSQTLATSIPSVDPSNVGDFEDYKGVLPDETPLASYICASPTDFELSRWLNLLEQTLSEHMGAALKRETTYVLIQDKENGSDPNEEMRENNQIVLAQSRCMMAKVHKLREEVLKAIQKDTDMAEKLKRCERVD